MRTRWLLLLVGAIVACGGPTASLDTPSRAREAFARAVTFYRNKVAVEGSYLWTYSEDLKVRRGEGEATATQGWVQPPGTPAVGMAYLRAYQATGDRSCLDAARETARALARTQLVSGGWDYRIEFDPERRKQWHYRSDLEAGDRDSGRRRRGSVYDDNTTQSALRLLLRVDAALGRSDGEIRRAREYGLDQLLAAQYPNGAWPQYWTGEPHDPARYPVLKARFPENWPREWPRGNYHTFYTLNDHVLRDIVSVLLEAHRTLGDARFLAAARRAGGFVRLAQLPEPQPVWAQQYNFQMEPAWARRFEPPAATAGESVGVIHLLIDLYLATGDEAFLEPIPPALAWYERSRLPDGQWARFYELRTNRPLFFTRQYQLVYTDDDLPTHYSFKGEYGVRAMRERYERLTRDGRERTLAAQQRRRTPEECRRAARELEPRVLEVVAALDDRGRWIERGLIRSDTFCRNLDLLSDYLALSAGNEPPPR